MPSSNKLYNSFTLIPILKSNREGYYEDIFRSDIFSFRFVAVLGFLIVIFFLVVDLVVGTHVEGVVMYRAFMILFFSAVFALSFVPYFQTTGKLMILSFSLAIGIVALILIMDHNSPRPSYFVNNSFFIVVYFVFTVLGIHFLPAVFLGVLLFFIYLFYYLNNGQLHPDSNLPFVFSIIVAGLSSAYVLERYKINRYFQKQNLADQKAKIEQLNAIKNKLFSVVSHDFRGPLKTLNGLIGLVNKDHISADEFKLYSKEIESNLSYSSELLENLLAWSKSQMDGYKITRKSFDLNKLIYKTIAFIEVSSQQKELNLKLELNT